MSANPQPRPLVTGDLDLLISRSLDGDLSGEEERELHALLSADPSARARYDAMARIVGRLEELPDPEPPFALGTRVQVQVETDTQGFAAVLHRYGFYFRPATVGIVALGLGVAAVVYSVRQSPMPTETVAAVGEQAAPASVDEGRVSVYFADKEKKNAVPAAEAAANEATPARTRSDEPKAAARQEPVLIASAEAPRAKEETAFAPERDRQALAASAPAPAPVAPAAVAAVAAPRGMTDESAAEGVAMQKSAASGVGSLRAAEPRATAAATVDVVGPSSSTALRPVLPLGLEGLSGPFEGTYRLELNASGRVVDVVRLVGASGTEPADLSERLKALSFAPAEEARTAGSVEVRVRLR